MFQITGLKCNHDCTLVTSTCPQVATDTPSSTAVCDAMQVLQDSSGSGESHMQCSEPSQYFCPACSQLEKKKSKITTRSARLSHMRSGVGERRMSAEQQTTPWLRRAGCVWKSQRTLSHGEWQQTAGLLHNANIHALSIRNSAVFSQIA